MTTKTTGKVAVKTWEHTYCHTYMSYVLMIVFSHGGLEFCMCIAFIVWAFPWEKFCVSIPSISIDCPKLSNI
jgi:hypothetical protein